MSDDRVQQEWVRYHTAQRYSGLSHTTIWRLVSKGELKAARIGRSVRIHLPTLRSFMEERVTRVGDDLRFGTESLEREGREEAKPQTVRR